MTQSPPKPFVREFADAIPYTQDEPGEALFKFLLEKDEVPGLQLGLVELKGPIHKTPAAHDTWEQVYLVLDGAAKVHLEGVVHDVEAQSMVVIPKHAMHSVEVAPGNHVRYIYINQYR